MKNASRSPTVTCKATLRRSGHVRKITSETFLEDRYTLAEHVSRPPTTARRLGFRTVSGRVVVYYEFCLVSILMICWRTCHSLMWDVTGVTCSLGLFVMRIILSCWLLVSLFFVVCCLSVVIMLVIMVCCSILVRLSLYVSLH